MLEEEKYKKFFFRFEVHFYILLLTSMLSGNNDNSEKTSDGKTVVFIDDKIKLLGVLKGKTPTQKCDFGCYRVKGLLVRSYRWGRGCWHEVFDSCPALLIARAKTHTYQKLCPHFVMCASSIISKQMGLEK